MRLWKYVSHCSTCPHYVFTLRANTWTRPNIPGHRMRQIRLRFIVSFRGWHDMAFFYQWIKAVETTRTWQSYAIECNRRTHIDNWTLSVLEDGVLEAVIFGSRSRTALTWSIDNLPKIAFFLPSNSSLTRGVRMLHVTSEIGQRKSNYMWASWTISQKYTRKGDIGIWNTRTELQFHNNKHMFCIYNFNGTHFFVYF